jgi:hypothetical protein
MTSDLMKPVPKTSSLLITAMDPGKMHSGQPRFSGIGVRIAIYAQNLLCFLPIIFYLFDGEISLDELAGIQDQSIGILFRGFFWAVRNRERWSQRYARLLILPLEMCG